MFIPPVDTPVSPHRVGLPRRRHASDQAAFLLSRWDRGTRTIASGGVHAARHGPRAADRLHGDPRDRGPRHETGCMGIADDARAVRRGRRRSQGRCRSTEDETPQGHEGQEAEASPGARPPPPERGKTVARGRNRAGRVPEPGRPWPAVDAQRAPDAIRALQDHSRRTPVSDRLRAWERPPPPERMPRQFGQTLPPQWRDARRRRQDGGQEGGGGFLRQEAQRSTSRAPGDSHVENSARATGPLTPASLPFGNTAGHRGKPAGQPRARASSSMMTHAGPERDRDSAACRWRFGGDSVAYGASRAGLTCPMIGPP